MRDDLRRYLATGWLFGLYLLLAVQFASGTDILWVARTGDILWPAWFALGAMTVIRAFICLLLDKAHAENKKTLQREWTASRWLSRAVSGSRA